MVKSAYIRLVAGSDSRPLHFLFNNEKAKVIWLHDSDSIIKKLLEVLIANFNISLTDIFIICNYSQCVYLERAKSRREEWSDIIASLGPKGIEFFTKNVLFLMNSQPELTNFRAFFPGNRVVLASNNLTLSEDIFDISHREKLYSAIYNAKPYDFKRHYLAAKLDDIALISYSEHRAIAEGRHFDIRTLNHKYIAWSVSDLIVSSLVNQAFCGLALSKSEGACYASTEYLLCGVPVVSTECHGGREEYYTVDNSIIVDAVPEAVAAAVDTWVKRTISGEVDAAQIRQEAIAKQIEYRKLVSSELSNLTGLDANRIYEDVVAFIRKDNKLKTYINYWVGEFEIFT